MISAGADSYGRIDLQFPRPSAILDTIKQIYVSRIPQTSKNDESTLEDPSNDPNFNEPVIDRLRIQREEVRTRVLFVTSSLRRSDRKIRVCLGD